MGARSIKIFKIEFREKYHLILATARHLKQLVKRVIRLNIVYISFLILNTAECYYYVKVINTVKKTTAIKSKAKKYNVKNA